MPPQEINKTFAELAGICWHEPLSSGGAACLCGKNHNPIISWPTNPDYAADPRLVLREMMKRKDWPEFLDTVGQFANRYPFVKIRRIDLDYILDTTGLLALEAIEFLRKEK